MLTRSGTMLNIFANSLNTAVLAARNPDETGSKSHDVPLLMGRSRRTISKLRNEVKTTSFTCAGNTYDIGTSDRR